MAELSKISGVAIADVAAVDAVLKANIASILGLTLPSGAAFLLDTYTGAAAGYSTRRIASGATNLMRIREDSGDTETDIGYDSNGDLDTAAIATHCGSANGYVVTWYDQAGSNNATQSTNANQPQIYDGTTQAVITENGKPHLELGSGQKFSTSLSLDNDPLFVNAVAKNTSGKAGIVQLDTSFAYLKFSLEDYSADASKGVKLFFGSGSNFTEVGVTGSIAQRVITAYKVSDDTRLFLNGTQTGVSGNDYDSTGTLGIKQRNDGGTLLLAEVLVYDSDQTSNRTGIESDINSEYLIYQPTDTPTSGLLATYSGAAAAYSVRQLANTAVISMTVRRDSDDEEKRFGFDSNGDLDTAGIASFCGSANGYVSQWWDQSTSGNHASQGTAASQPQIYNGTAMITENGKPALQYNNAEDLQSSVNFSSANLSAFTVNADDATTGNDRFWLLTDSTNTIEIQALYHQTNNDIRVGYRKPENEQVVFGTADNAQHLVYYNKAGTASQVAAVDGGSTTSNTATVTTATITQLYLGSYDGGFFFDGRIQEVVFWASDQSSNRTGIESDINTYFSIY